jgi:hypothetical protein
MVVAPVMPPPSDLSFPIIRVLDDVRDAEHFLEDADLGSQQTRERHHVSPRRRDMAHRLPPPSPESTFAGRVVTSKT